MPPIILLNCLLPFHILPQHTYPYYLQALARTVLFQFPFIYNLSKHQYFQAQAQSSEPTFPSTVPTMNYVLQ